MRAGQYHPCREHSDLVVEHDLLEGIALLRRGAHLHELVGDLDAAFDWIAARRGKYTAFATAGARDPGLPQLAKRIASL